MSPRDWRFRLEDIRLWQTVHQDLPPLKSKIEKLIQSS